MISHSPAMIMQWWEERDLKRELGKSVMRCHKTLNCGALAGCPAVQWWLKHTRTHDKQTVCTCSIPSTQRLPSRMLTIQTVQTDECRAAFRQKRALTVRAVGTVGNRLHVSQGCRLVRAVAPRLLWRDEERCQIDDYEELICKKTQQNNNVCRVQAKAVIYEIFIVRRKIKATLEFTR